MAVISWDPNRDLNLLQGDMNRLFDRFFPQGGGQGGAGQSRFIPALDLVEHEDHFLLMADLPGVAEEDVAIEVEDRTLRISGERKSVNEGSEQGVRRFERQWGAFERTVLLPAGIDVDAITADFHNGVLELRVPKPEQQRPRRVRIGGGRSETIEGRQEQQETIEA